MNISTDYFNKERMIYLRSGSIDLSAINSATYNVLPELKFKPIFAQSVDFLIY